MPFDGLADDRQQYLLDKLDAVSGLLACEQKWCKRHMRTPDGGRCLLGALIDAKARWLFYRSAVIAAREVTGKHYHRVESFNDDFTTSFTEVQAVLERIRATLIAGTARQSPLQRITSIFQRRFERTHSNGRWSRVIPWLT